MLLYCVLDVLNHIISYHIISHHPALPLGPAAPNPPPRRPEVPLRLPAPLRAPPDESSRPFYMI